MVKLSAKKRNSIIIAIVLFAALVFLIFPIITIVMTAFKTFEDIQIHPGRFFPSSWTFSNFGKVFSEFPFARYLLNSLIITVSTCLGTVLTSSLVAYGFARFRCKIKGPLFAVMLATMFIPGQVLQIPLFEMYREFGWFDTYFPFILPSFLGGGIVNVFLIRQFFESVPKSYYESARIDGANEFIIFARIAVPLAKPIILTVAVFTFVGSWNDFFSPLLYLNDESFYTLAYGLYITFSKFEVAGQTAWNLVCASNLVVILPIVILYFICQKYFVEGLAIGGEKG